MVTLKHDSHEHELNLIEVDAYMVGKGKCGVCEMQIYEASLIYRCLTEDCPNNSLSLFFFLHKSCAELPKQITHPHHPQHSLVLGREYNQEIVKLTRGSLPHLTACKLCSRQIDEQMWNYFCKACSYEFLLPTNAYLHIFTFSLCIRCAIMEPAIHHEVHKHHSLTLLRRQLSLICDACGITEENDFCYSCLPCQFWIHSSCAASPATIKLRFHQDDTLHLIYSVPHMYRSFTRHCQICKNEVLKDKWAYFCEDSGYFVHITCARTLLASGENEIKHEAEEEEEDYAQPHPDLLQFPLPSTDSLVANLLANHQSKNPSTITNPVAEEPVIQHWSHEHHPLVLSEKSTFKGDADSDDDENDDILICNGCTTPILNQHKYYQCIRCNYFLHISCANHLPIKFPAGKCLADPDHSLNLDKLETKLGRNLSIAFCHSCHLPTNGFGYRCNSCSKLTDIICCLLPDKIKHDSHKHALVQHFNHPSFKMYQNLCTACLAPVLDGFDYRCETCIDVQIHQHCAMLYPKSITHRFDSHTISLLYPPIYYKGIKYCEICELQVNPEAWLYWCRHCDQCFHPNCIRAWHNMKLGDKIFHGGIHHHNLTLVAIDKDRYPQRIHKSLECSQGHDNGSSLDVYLECAGCNFLFCRSCNKTRGTSGSRLTSPVTSTRNPVSENRNPISENRNLDSISWYTPWDISRFQFSSTI